MELFLECVFVPFSCIADKGEFISNYSLQLAIAICLFASIEKYVFAMCGYPYDYALYSCDSSSH